METKFITKVSVLHFNTRKEQFSGMFCHKSGRVSDTIYDKDIESFDGSRRGSCQTVSTVETWLSDFDIVEERPFQQKDRGKVELEHVVVKKEENLSSNPLKFLFLLLMGKIEYLHL